MTKDLWFDSWQGQEIYIFTKMAKLAVGAQPFCCSLHTGVEGKFIQDFICEI
jgi:hypothetical protein